MRSSISTMSGCGCCCCCCFFFQAEDGIRDTSVTGVQTCALPIYQWETAWGQDFLKRMIISVIYTFGIKGGMGSDRISEHLGHLQIEGVAAVSESSIYRSTNEIISNIMLYKQLQESGLSARAKAQMEEMEVVLGLDETWLDEMLLVCQDLMSGYLFLNSGVKNETSRVGSQP